MTRFLTVGAAQMGPIQRSHTRRDVVERLIAHLREAKRMGCAGSGPFARRPRSGNESSAPSGGNYRRRRCKVHAFKAGF